MRWANDEEVQDKEVKDKKVNVSDAAEWGVRIAFKHGVAPTRCTFQHVISISQLKQKGRYPNSAFLPCQQEHPCNQRRKEFENNSERMRTALTVMSLR